MTEFEPGIRNGARAVVIKDGKLLLLRKESPDYGTRYVLPGGSQDLGETLAEALGRECLEELGTSVRVNDLLHVADFFKDRFTEPKSYRHVVEFLFDCSVDPSYVPANGPHPDRHQVGVEWVPLADLADLPFWPRAFAGLLAGMAEGKSPQASACYQGLVE